MWGFGQVDRADDGRERRHRRRGGPPSNAATAINRANLTINCNVTAETAATLFCALLASGRITMRKVDGWQTLGEKLADPAPVDLAA